MSRDKKQELVDELVQLARAHEAANDAFDEVAREKLGINRTDLRCLNIIDNAGTMTAGRLAELSGLTTAAVTSVLDRLERAGYARRVRDQPDRRQVMVEVTPLLAERATPIWGPLGEEARSTLSRMSAEELRALIDFYRLGIELNERHIDRVRHLDTE
ncbi:MAG TPA: MarR family transcriptional regulator [Gaiellaceae bacterium]|nr:MarR family transcriptional regulator [Gaiellaceae bacterium]